MQNAPHETMAQHRELNQSPLSPHFSPMHPHKKREREIDFADSYFFLRISAPIIAMTMTMTTTPAATYIKTSLVVA